MTATVTRKRRLNARKDDPATPLPDSPKEKARSINGTVLMPIRNYNVQPVPGIAGAERASGYIKVDELPDLAEFCEVNPRTPRLSSPVVKDIMNTLTQHPLQMTLKNRGIVLVVGKLTKGDNLMVELKDPQRHGIVDGGHTYAAIREVLEHGTDEEKHQARKASLPVHVFSGVPHDLAVEMSAGLNYSRQVQKISLDNLRGYYDPIRAVLKGTPAENSVAYEEGEKKPYKIGEVLGYLEMFNFDRYTINDNPYDLYAHVGNVAQRASEDLSTKNAGITLAINHLPDILKLADMIHAEIQPLRHKIEPNRRKRGRPRKGGAQAKAPKDKAPRIVLPFTGVKVVEKLTAGWLYPILAAFRANLKVDLKEGTFKWIKPNDKVLKAAASELVAICQAEQHAAANKPEWVGKRESAYRQCKMMVDLTVQKLSEK